MALWQAEQTSKQLEELGVPSEIMIIKTKGDQIQHLSFDKLEGKGFFTSELEEALLEEKIDLAVHSMKDLPTQMNDQLVIAGVSQRANPADWLIINRSASDLGQTLKLKVGAIVGTSSARRKCQLLSIRKDLVLKDIRGNVPTRLQKLADHQFDAIMLAAAGLIRLEIDLEQFIVVKLHPREFVPAPAQGVLAYQTRIDDMHVRNILTKLHHAEVAQLTNVERSVLKLFDGGCHLPLGVYCEGDVLGNFHVWAAYASDIVSPIKRSKLSYNTTKGLAEGIFENLTTAI